MEDHSIIAAIFAVVLLACFLFGLLRLEGLLVQLQEILNLDIIFVLLQPLGDCSFPSLNTRFVTLLEVFIVGGSLLVLGKGVLYPIGAQRLALRLRELVLLDQLCLLFVDLLGLLLQLFICF